MYVCVCVFADVSVYMDVYVYIKIKSYTSTYFILYGNTNVLTPDL